MGVSDPKTWVPYMNTKDCSQGICSMYCPQWCYIIFPPPPPYYSSDEDSGTHLSPLVIAIIGILASALLLVSYYAVVSKFCRNMDPQTRDSQEHNGDETADENPDGLLLEPWFISSAGLDESVIKSITVCKYRRGGGLIESTDCCVCLGGFEEDEVLRLLPKCSHAFHVICIDTWLKSHSNCPLCRASVVSPCVQLPEDFFSLHGINNPPDHDSLPGNEQENGDQTAGDDSEAGVREERMLRVEDRRKNGSLRDDNIIEIVTDGGHRVRGSISMDHSRPSQVSIADILGLDDGGGCRMECPIHGHVASKGVLEEVGKSCSSSSSSSSSSRSRMLDLVVNAASMRRSVSSGRFLFSSRDNKGFNAVVPV